MALKKLHFVSFKFTADGGGDAMYDQQEASDMVRPPYAGKAGQLLRINSTEDFTEWTPAPGYGVRVRSEGTPQVITTTPTIISCGGIPCSITIAQAGTYVLFFTVAPRYNGVTYHTDEFITVMLRRTNHTPTDVLVPLPLYLGRKYDMESTPRLSGNSVYVALVAGDIIEMRISVSALPANGDMTCEGAVIIALRTGE